MLYTQVLMSELSLKGRFVCCDSSHLCSSIKREKLLSGLIANIIWTTIPS